MKTKLKLIVICHLVLAICLSARAQGTAFTYQGRLSSGGSPASGTYNLTFTLFGTNITGVAIAGPVTNNAVVVTNGLFTVLVDFGSSVWNGETNWLEIGVETNLASSFITLVPRQQLTPVPYAITAENLDGTVGSGGLSGVYGSQITLNNAANLFSGSYTGNGGGLTNVNAASLGGLAVGSFWQLGGNASVPTGSNVIGTLGNQYLDIRANGVRAMRLRLLTDGLGYYTNAPNVIGGSSVNLTGPAVVGGAIAGGGGQDTNGLNYPNTVNADFGAIAGGLWNTASGFASAVSGGEQNTASGSTASVNGGYINTASGNTAAVGGGFANTAVGAFSTVGGGAQNVARNISATVSGGEENLAGGNGSFVGGGGYDGSTYAGNMVLSAASTIGGGLGNTITTVANYSFIGGGSYNQIYSDFYNKGGSVIVGGGGNLVSSNAAFSFIGGGLANQIFGDGSDNGSSVIVGGYANKVLTNSAPAFIGGGVENIVSSNSSFSTIGGGFGNTAAAQYATVVGGNLNTARGTGSFVGGGGYDGTNATANSVLSPAGTIGGGLGNTIASSASYAFIGGGIGNTATGVSSFVGGGGFGGEFNFPNSAAGKASVIGGGVGNTNTSSADWATIGGGLENTCADTGATVCGGDVNTASGLYSTVCGGAGNSATGIASFAAGYFARSLHDDAFVWSDGSGTGNFTSTAVDQFLIHAIGGVGIGTNNPQAQLHVTSSGGNSFPQAQLDQQNPTDYSRLRFTVGGNINKRWDVGTTATNFVIYSASINANMVYLDSSGLTVHGHVRQH